MKYYPVFLNLKDRLVLLVGAGDIGLQKIRGLLECQARIHVVSPEALPAIADLAAQGTVAWSKRGYETADLEGSSLVIAATNDPALQKRIASEARARKIWVNIVDVPPYCDFIAPAIVNRGDLQIAISTGGAAPALAKFLRQKLEASLGPEYGEFVTIVDKWRPEILKMPKPQRQSLWECIVSQAFLDQIKEQGALRAEAALKEWIQHGKPAL